MFEKLTENLIRLGYTVFCFETVEKAKDYIDQAIDGKTVGFGGSVTLSQIGLYDLLSSHNEVYWHQGIVDKEKSDEIRKKAADADIYISSVNALAETGEIVNIDGVGNRVASIMYGHKKVYLVIGKNKIEKDYEAALWRARNIAGPLNAKRLGRNTPCVIGGRCFNCASPERICRELSVLWCKPVSSDIEIILVGEELGY